MPTTMTCVLTAANRGDSNRDYHLAVHPAGGVWSRQLEMQAGPQPLTTNTTENRVSWLRVLISGTQLLKPLG
jgi:hypothetical protein